MTNNPEKLSLAKGILLGLGLLLWLAFNVVICLHGTDGAAYSLAVHLIFFAVVWNCPKVQKQTSPEK